MIVSHAAGPLRSLVLASAAVAAAACASRSATAPATAAPMAVTLPVDSAFERAVQRGTRTRTGRPGPRYWQQYARYSVQAELDPEQARLTGESATWYFNRSPDTLRSIAVFLYQNLHAQGAPTNTPVPTTGGITLTRVAAQGQELAARAAGDSGVGYTVQHTVSWIRPPRPVLPGDSVELRFAWSFRVPPEGAPRMGQDGEIFFVAYWYPQVAVYDDLSGWHTDPYLGNGEFYMGYADYDVSITLPDVWLVDATGTLQNADQVLSEQTRQRLAAARTSQGVTHVATLEDRTSGAATT
ncbi:MAG: M1 family metallopeptidase, partial [Gemmatimonadaceae bacterium]